MDWKDNLFTEENLWTIYRQSPGVARRPFNLLIAILSFLFLLAFVIWDRYVFAPSIDAINYVETIRSWASLGINFSSTILGFLLAGFTVFATITNPRLFVALAKADHNDFPYSELKFAFFSFLNVFVNYLSFLSLVLVIELLGKQEGVISVFTRVC